MQKQNSKHCPFSPEDIAAFADHAPENKARQNEIAAHLLACGSCAALAKKIYADKAALQRAQTKAPEGFLAAVLEKTTQADKAKTKRLRFYRAGFGFAAAAMLFLVVGVGWHSRFGANSEKSMMVGMGPAGDLTYEDAPADVCSGERTASYSMPENASDKASFLPPEALFPEANGLLLLAEEVWNAAGISALEMLRVETEEGGFLAAFSVSAAEFEMLRSEKQLLRENPQTDGGEPMYIVLVALSAGE